MSAWRAGLALLLLNALLSFNLLWPTPLILPDHRLAPAFILLWTGLLAWQRWRGAPGPRLLGAVATFMSLLVLLRYLDVAVPGLFGRPINLYWDVQHLPRFLWVSAEQLHPLLALLAGGLGLLLIVAGLVGLKRGLQALWTRVARELLPQAAHSRLAWALTVFGLLSVAGNVVGLPLTWPYISKPILPTYARQAELLFTIASPGGAERELPPSPAFDGKLDALGGQDFKLFFLESYGAIVDDDPAMRAALAPARAELAQAAADAGRWILSAYLRSPTYGGASDLAHLSLLSGIDLADPRRHDLLLTTERKTLVHHFMRYGYRSFGVYPGLSWAWPESRHYGYETLVDGPALAYTGPKLGYWWIPDQYSLAKLEQLHPRPAEGPPRFMVYASITSHIPFSPVPPYQPDWSRVLGPEPFEPEATARALAEQADWLNLRPGYTGMMVYNMRMMAGYLRAQTGRPELLMMLGDHQPASGVTGPDQPWEVPVHVVGTDPALRARFEALGFRPGVQPQRPALGGMHELTGMLLRVFDADSPLAARSEAGPMPSTP